MTDQQTLNDFAAFDEQYIEPLHPEVQLILKKMPRAACNALAVTMADVRDPSADRSDSHMYFHRGRVIGQSEGAWMRSEISQEDHDVLVAYASGSPV